MSEGQIISGGPGDPIQFIPGRKERSDYIGKLAEALSKAQGAMEGASKSAENPFFKSKYADLASVWDACRGPLSANGLAVIQVPAAPTAPGRVAIDTILAHASGEWISGVLELTPVKSDPQSVGSAITYARRYGLQAIVGIAPEDDDGNAASGTDKAGVNPNLWPRALTKEEVKAKEAAGQLKGQKPFVRPPSPEQAEEARKWAMDAATDPGDEEAPAYLTSRVDRGDMATVPIQDQLKAIEDAARAKHGVTENCEKCHAQLVTGISNSKDNPGRKYMVCHHAYQQRAKLQKEGKTEAEIGKALSGHTRYWLPQVPPVMSEGGR
jgi:hypothetical protein